MKRHLISFIRHSFITTAVLVLEISSACSKVPVKSGGSASTTIVQAIPQTNLPPLKVAIFPDQSGSANWTKTPQLTTADLQMLIVALSVRGGELGFGLIRDRSNKGLVRLRIGAPPPPPAKPDSNGNAFRKAQEMQAYQIERSKYDKILDDRKKEIEERVKVFLFAIEPLLKQPADARRTDVWGALTRANLFLSEPDTTWLQPPLFFVVLVSDGMDTAKSTPVSLNKDVMLILVNGSASKGTLASLKPACFESVEAAFRFIITAEGGQ